MNKFCNSCGIPLDGKVAKEAAENFCNYCVDDKGDLKPRQVIQAGVADWLKSVAPTEKKGDFMKRADHYLKAMPAWAED